MREVSIAVQDRYAAAEEPLISTLLTYAGRCTFDLNCQQAWCTLFTSADDGQKIINRLQEKVNICNRLIA